jgi:hypothetical protein
MIRQNDVYMPPKDVRHMSRQGCPESRGIPFFIFKIALGQSAHWAIQEESTLRELTILEKRGENRVRHPGGY